MLPEDILGVSSIHQFFCTVSLSELGPFFLRLEGMATASGITPPADSALLARLDSKLKQ
jgi:hypothetical protein